MDDTPMSETLAIADVAWVGAGNAERDRIRLWSERASIPFTAPPPILLDEDGAAIESLAETEPDGIVNLMRVVGPENQYCSHNIGETVVGSMTT